MPEEQALPPPVAGQFEDADPEDAYSVSDTVVEQLHNLVHRLDFVLKHNPDAAERTARLLRVRIDLLRIQRRLRTAAEAIFGPDIDFQGRAPEADDD